VAELNKVWHTNPMETKSKIGLKKVTTLQFWYIVAFVITACISTYLYDLDIVPSYSWLPFLIGIVGFIHVKYFQKT
jgi:hypothetical protein